MTVVTTLGNGENRAFIYDRTGTDRLLELVTTQVEWPREYCGIGRAAAQIAPSRCSPDHAKIAAWAHTLVVYRDKERVWEGPVRRVTHGPGGLGLVASDVLGWTERRPLRETRTVLGSPVVSELQWALGHAFGTDDPNVLAHVRVVNDFDLGPGVDLDVKAAGAYVSGNLSTIVAAGGRFTALGRGIFLWAEATIVGRTRTLVPERHLLTDVNVIEDGDSLATEVTARDDDGNVAVTLPPDNIDPRDGFYGHVGLIVSSGKSGPAAVASSVMGQSYPSPVTIEVPSGAALSCDSPFPIAHLVPGVLVPVETTTATGKTYSATQVLSSVKVTQAAGDDEKVGITLTQLSAAVS